METIFYRCPVCGNIMLRVSEAGNAPYCCGRPMVRLEAGTSDGKTEYHVPVIKLCKDGELTVCVGQAPHPMTEQHHIQFIYLATEHGGQIRYLQSGAEAVATFHVADKPVDSPRGPLTIFAYCNLHGLWKHEIKPSECKK